MTVENRVVELETRFTFLDGTVEELNEVICRQQKQIDQLEITCKHLMQTVKILTGGGDGSEAAIETPPHY